jgi:hypothetical protein
MIGQIYNNKKYYGDNINFQNKYLYLLIRLESITINEEIFNIKDLIDDEKEMKRKEIKRNEKK